MKLSGTSEGTAALQAGRFLPGDEDFYRCLFHLSGGEETHLRRPSRGSGTGLTKHLKRRNQGVNNHTDGGVTGTRVEKNKSGSMSILEVCN